MSFLDNFSEFLGQKKKKDALKIRMKSLAKDSLPAGIGDKLKITANSNKNEWSSDLQHNIISYPTEGKLSILEQKDYEVIAFLLHEVAHHLHTELDLRQLKIDRPTEAYTQTLNSFEDIRVEYQTMSQYPGTYDSYKKSNIISQQAIDEKEVLKEVPDYILFINNFIRKEWGIEPILNENIEKHWNSKEIQDAVTNLKESPSTTKMNNDFIFDHIWNSIKELIDDDPKADSDNLPKESDAKSALDNYVDKDKKEQLEDEMEQQEQEAQDDKMPVKQTGSDTKKEQTKESEEEQMKAEPDVKSSDYDCLREERLSTLNDKEDNKDELEDNDYYNFLTYEELYEMIEPYLLYFRKKLSSILKDNRLARQGGTFRSGKLNTKKLYKWKCDDTKVFSRKVMRQHKDYNVVLVVDESSSMRGERALNATKTAVLLAEVLDYCGIPFSVIGFNSDLREYKKLNEPFTWVKKRNLESILPSVSGATSDAFALNVARHHLENTVGENIVFVLTDGGSNPSSLGISAEHKKRLKGKYTKMDDFDIMKEVTELAKKAFVVGIGIGNSTELENADIYKHIISIEDDDIDLLPGRILQLLQRYIKRG